MANVRAVVVDPASAGHLRIGEVEEPRPRPDEAVVRVSAVSLNLGEVRRATQEPSGTRIGWDLAGTVVAAAADGAGPREGARVVGILPRGAWAEAVAVPTNSLAALPDEVSFRDAATLPVAGLTALYALEKRGSLTGRKVLVTGASGGVGHFACQIARDAGAHVVGLIRRQALEGLTREAGAEEVVVGEDATVAAPFGPYDAILDSVGGHVLGQTLGLLAPDGVCVSYGVSAGSEVTFDARRFFRSGRASLYGLYLFAEFGRHPAWEGLRRLARMVAAGRLEPHVDHERPWESIGEAARGLLDRKFAGKVVLTLD